MKSNAPTHIVKQKKKKTVSYLSTLTFHLLLTRYLFKILKLFKLIFTNYYQDF